MSSKAVLISLLSIVSTGVVTNNAASQGGPPIAPLGGPVPISSCQAIVEPGSYILTTNLTFDGNGGCLTVTANDVTIDLNGFEILYTGISAAEGISNPFGNSGIAVRNGTIRNFTSGVDLAEGVGTDSLVEGIRAIGNAHGIRVGERSVVRNNVTNNNSGAGVFARCPSSLAGNVALDNGFDFFFAADPTPEACSCIDNFPNPPPATCAETP